MTLEEKILAYLDGALDENTSEELLHSLSISPEKRAVLEEHLALRNMLALGQKPFAIPASVERTLAERIPALTATETSTRIARTGVFASLFSSASDWLAGIAEAPALRWSAGIASVAAIGFSVWMLVGSSQSNSGNVAVRNSQPLATSEAPHANVPQSDAARTNSFGESMANNTRGASDNGGASSVRSDRGRTLFAPADRAPLHMEGSPTPLTVSDPEQTEVNGSISAVASRSALTAVSGPSITLPEPLQPSLLDPHENYRNLRITLALSQYQYDLPDVGGAQSVALSRPEIAVSYDLSHAFALRLEGGTALYPVYGLAAKNERVTSITGQSYSRVVYSTSLQPTEALFTRLGFEYTINRGDNYEFHLTSTGGVQFAPSFIPIASIGAGISHPLNSLLSLDLSALAIGSWGSSTGASLADTTAPSLTGPVGVVHRNVSVGRVFASALGIRAGLRYQF